MNLRATLIEQAPKLSQTLDLEMIRADRDGLEIGLVGEKLDGCTTELCVRFEEVIGFRCLDETDLLEFWPACGLKNGWLYEVLAGGWRSLESNRLGFTSQAVPFHREFLVVTRDTCVSVIAKVAPIIVSIPQNLGETDAKTA